MACTSVPSSPSFCPKRTSYRGPFKQSSPYRKFVDKICFNYNKRSLFHNPSCPHPRSAVSAEVPTLHTNAPSLLKSTRLEPSPLPSPQNPPSKPPVVTPVLISILAPYLSGYLWANFD
ncbi:hypothetical protein DPMN_192008 [Dreissena polymorpha]|uniref:Uncharacterized protein n=1 Tax=Dreissena polymorpha TaxID=45954 RepID=A0A9D4BDK1_DREPO|nr:hypothetical protein DPMN_192008 [Dreissena polymorpha]